jgi:hypothetical protein
MSRLTDRWGFRAIIRISEHTCFSGKAAGSCALGKVRAECSMRSLTLPRSAKGKLSLRRGTCCCILSNSTRGLVPRCRRYGAKGSIYEVTYAGEVLIAGATPSLTPAVHWLR